MLGSTTVVLPRATGDCGRTRAVFWEACRSSTTIRTDRPLLLMPLCWFAIDTDHDGPRSRGVLFYNLDGNVDPLLGILDGLQRLSNHCLPPLLLLKLQIMGPS